MIGMPAEQGIHANKVMFVRIVTNGDSSYHAYSILRGTWRLSTDIVSIQVEDGVISWQTRSGSTYSSRELANYMWEGLPDDTKNSLKNWFGGDNIYLATLQEVSNNVGEYRDN